MHSPDFKGNAVKVLGGHEKDLTSAEKEALRPFQRATSRSSDSVEKSVKLGFADRIRKRKKITTEALGAPDDLFY